MKKILFHPFLFALYPILFFFSYNKAELSLTDRDFLLSIAISLLVVLLLYLSAKIITKNSEKSTAFVSLVVVLFFFYGHARGLISNFYIEVLGVEIGPDKVILFLWGIVFLVSLYLLIKTKKSLAKLSTFLNVVSASVVLISLFQIIPYEIQTFSEADNHLEIEKVKPAEEVAQEKLDYLPDIYYIIFDRYTNNINLQKNFGFDNSEFTNYLEDKGFFVAYKSVANYLHTYLSLASSLNLTYLNQLSEEIGEESDNKEPAYKMVRDYEVWRFLKERGYTFVHFGDWWSLTSRNGNADLNINYASSITGEFITRLLETTMYKPIADSLSVDPPHRNINRERTLYKFEKLSEMSEVAGPKFVFAHMLTVHWPYVFKKDGTPLYENEKRTEKTNFTESILFTNEKMKNVIESLIENSPRPPVIIIQADEGHYGGRDKEDWAKNYMGILNAYYLPEVDTSKVLYQDITPVNTFRIIFNSYFGTNYEMLEDKSYISQDSKHIYKFIDVTEKVRF